MRLRVFLGLRRRSLVTGTVILALAVALSGAVDSLHRLVRGVRPGVTLEGIPAGGFWPGEVVGLVDDFARREFRRPRDAYLDKRTGKVVPEEWGLAVDRQGTVRAVLTARWGEEVTAVRVPARPRYFREDVEGLTATLGSYSTWVRGSSERVHNIALAANEINRTLLYPGDIFSFNAVVGPRTAERGFLPAPTISEGRVVDDEGGGICQVATTVYDACVSAGLEVIERHPHSRRVSYVPEGKDATVAYGQLDLVVANRKTSPVVILAYYGEGRVRVTVMGRRASR